MPTSCAALAEWASPGRLLPPCTKSRCTGGTLSRGVKDHSVPLVPNLSPHPTPARARRPGEQLLVHVEGEPARTTFCAHPLGHRPLGTGVLALSHSYSHSFIHSHRPCAGLAVRDPVPALQGLPVWLEVRTRHRGCRACRAQTIFPGSSALRRGEARRGLWRRQAAARAPSGSISSAKQGCIRQPPVGSV